MITIRPARITDLQELERIFYEVRQGLFTWSEPDQFKLEDYQKSVAGELVWVAVFDNKVVGFISIWEPSSFIHNLFVAIEQQGKGIGRLLLNKAVELVPSPLQLKVDVPNNKAIEFYKREGWHEISRHINPETSENYILMQFP